MIEDQKGRKMATFYKIINLSVASGLVSKDGIIRVNPVYGAISLAPNWRSLAIWYMALTKGYLSIPYGAENTYIAEVEIEDEEEVLFAKNALNLNNVSWGKIPAREAVNASINGWVGGCSNFYGINPEVRVERNLKISKLWKIDARLMDELEMVRPERWGGEYDNILGKELEDPEIRGFIEKIDSLKSNIVEVSRIEKAIADVKKLCKYRYPTRIPEEDSATINYKTIVGEVIGALILSGYKKLNIKDTGEENVRYEDFYDWPGYENYLFKIKLNEFYTPIYDESIEFDIDTTWLVKVINYLDTNNVSVIELLNRFKSPIAVLKYLDNQI